MNARYISGLMAMTAIVLLSSIEPACAQQQENKPVPGNGLPGVPLLEVLDAASDNSDMTFVVGVGVASDVVVGPLRTRDVTYASLLTILGNNGLAAVTIGDEVSVVPVDAIRQYPLPLLTEKDDSVAAQEWVTWVVPLANARAAELVPILRPLLPRAGHLAANDSSNSMLIVDRYANARRVHEILMRMDSMAD